MKILYVAASPVPSKAANSVHVVKMAQALAHNGHQVELMVPVPLAKLGHLDVPVYEFYGVDNNFRFTQKALWPTKLGVLFYALQATIKAYLSGASFIFTRCLPTAFVATSLGIKTLYERHSDFGAERVLNRRLYAWLARSPKHLGTVVVSQALKENFHEEFSVPSEKVIVAADGSDPLPSLTMPCPFEKPDGRLAAGYIGHLYKGRGIEIIAAMAQRCPAIDFHIVGGTPEDIAYWAAELAGISNLYLHGHVPHAKTKEYLVNFDMVLAPYQKKVAVAGGGHTERWMSPLKIFEYMSSGKPLICSDMPVLHEVLRDSDNCVLCPPEDVDSWVTAANNLATNKELGRRLATKALDDFMTHYTWRERSKRIIAVISNQL
jgi:glycosyltransferase involved in cell wall biosynthesis